ncbi:MAG: uracil-DNA glycosylase [Xanthobacteraceae bacterium]|jgi:uracil-DNA glycosylase
MHSKTALGALLVFYRETGVDTPVGETAMDRLAPDIQQANIGSSAPRSANTQAAGTLPRSRPSTRRVAGREPLPAGVDAKIINRPAAVATPEAGLLAASAAARAAGNLEELKAALAAFEGCSLRQTATQLVFADGNPAARVMFVGEAPGRDEDITGLPFVGRSGKLLDRMMAAIGLDRSSAYIANIVPWRPPGNRTPTPQESAICLPFMLRQIELANPDILVCLGGPSAQTLLNVRDGILKLRGRWFPFWTGTCEIRAIATLHPAYLLRQPLQKRLAWRDFVSIMQALRA